MTIDERVLDLVERAQELQAQGLPVDPDELCRDCPDLREALVQALGAAHCMGRLLGTTGGEGATDVAAPAGPPAGLLAVPGSRQFRFISCRFVSFRRLGVKGFATKLRFSGLGRTVPRANRPRAGSE
jgi:hypothetical protein